jgi:CBS domain-containing protein
MEADMLARDIMTVEPTCVTPDDTIAHAAALMRTHDVGILPVVDDRATMRLEGVLTDRDITVRCVAEHHGARCRVRDHMSADHLDTARPDSDMEDVIARMERDQVRRVPVVDERNRLVGIIAQADIATRMGPKAPLKVEELLERISSPAHAMP